jgi:ubiquinol-cytochrome c reductase iron-sulfur subunit
MEDLSTLNDKLADPQSQMPQQPEYAQNEFRARETNPEIAVLIGICTHLGCSPTYRPEIAPADLGQAWRGGFFCPCHGSRFDLAGRVYSGVPAPTNLEVPPHAYLSDTRLLIGKDEEGAA